MHVDSTGAWHTANCANPGHAPDSEKPCMQAAAKPGAQAAAKPGHAGYKEACCAACLIRLVSSETWLYVVCRSAICLSIFLHACITVV